MADNASLDGIITDQINNFLQDPQNLPPEFLAWLPQYLTTNAPQLQNSDLSGGTLTPADGAAHSIAWGTGTLTFAGGQTASDSQLHGLGGTPVFVVAYASVTGCVLTGSGDPNFVNTTGWFSAAHTGTVSYFWLAIL